MTNQSSILAEGARRVWKQQRIVWWVFAVNLLLAFVSAMPLAHPIGNVTNHSLAARRLVNGFDWGMYSELLTTPDVNFGSHIPAAGSAVLVFFIFMLFMRGGILASYANEYSLSTREFFANCGAFFWRLVRLFFFMAIILTPIVIAGRALVEQAGKAINDAAGEKTGYWFALLAILLMLFTMTAVRLWFDMAQVRAVVEDQSGMARTCREAFKVTFSNFASLFWIYLRISFLAWLALALGLWLWVRLSGGVAIIMLEAVLLWWVGTRMWQRASEVAWYQSRLTAPSSGGADWTVVGHYDEGDVQQCVVLADAEILMSTYNNNSYTQATATLKSVADYPVLQRALEQNPTLHLEVRHEAEAREEGIKGLNGLLNFAAYFVGSIMAIGATLGAVNSLYSIVDARRREIATLRAIGFGAAPVAASILCESILLALPGALLGVLLAWAFFHRMAVSPFGFSFLLDVTPRLAVIGVVWALAMGLIGGLLPALRAARVPVTTALRAT